MPVISKPPVPYIYTEWMQQPDYSAEIDWSNPITRGLLFYQTGGHDFVSGNEARPVDPTSATPATVGYDALGKYIESNGNTDGGWTWDECPDMYRLGGSIECSVFSIHSIDLYYSFSSLIGCPTYVDTSWAAPFWNISMIREASTTSWDLYITAQGTSSRRRHISDTGMIDTGTLETNEGIAVTWNNRDGLARFYKNGIWYSSNSGADASTVGAIIDTPTNGRLFTASRNDDATSEGTNGRFNVAAIWNRQLSSEEILSLYKNPWQVFKPRAIPAINLPTFRRMLSINQVQEQKPDYEVEIDWNNPLTENLSCALVFDENSSVARDLAKGQPNAATVNAVINSSSGGLVYNDFGKAIKTLENATYYAYGVDWTTNLGPKIDGGTGGKGCSVFFVGKINSATGTRAPILQCEGSSHSFYVNPSTRSVNWRASATTIQTSTEVLPTFPCYAKIGGTFQKSVAASICLNGVYESTTAGSFTLLGPCEALGNGQGAGALMAEYNLFLMWGDRVLSESELKSLNDNPWQIFKPKRHHIIISREHLIETSITRTSQPPEGMIDIDFNNPINKDLAFAYTPQSHIGREHTSGSFAYWPVAAGSAATGAPQVTATKFGRALHGIDNVSTEGGLHWNTNASYNVQGSYITAMLLFRPNSNTWATYNSSMFNSKKVGGFSGWSFVATRSAFTNKFTWMCRDATSSINVDLNSVRLSTLDLQKQYCMIGVYDNGPMRTYMNGIADIANESTGLSGPLYNGIYYPIGIWSENINYDHLQDSMDILLAAVWNRVLSPQEIAYISANPWQIFAPEKVFIPTNYEPFASILHMPTMEKP